MIVAHITFQYGLGNVGGAAIASTRLHQALLSHGVESHYICVYQREQGTNIHELPKGWRRRAFLSLTKITRWIWRFTPYRSSICLNVISLFGLEKTLAKISPDIVHVQWLNADVCSFERLAKLPYKMIFNLHDLYMLLPGGEVYPGKDRRFIDGLTQMNSTWIERFLMRRKERLVRRKASAFIGPSDWVCKMASESVVGREIPAYSIPNIIDERFFAEPIVRQRNEKFAILFGAYGGRASSYKGFSDLERALALLPNGIKVQCELRIFGEAAEPSEISGVKTVFLGNVTDVARLREIYFAADIFVFPSVQETQGMAKVEAMLCGLPVVAFNRTACAEGIEHLGTGWVAADGDCRSFAEGLQYFYKEWQEGMLDCRKGRIAEMARSMYFTEGILGSVQQIYSDCIK